MGTGAADMILRGFLGEVGRFVFFFGLDCFVGLDAKEGGGGLLVFAVGELPEDTVDGDGVVVERQRAGGDAGMAAFTVSIVESGSADAHDNVCNAAVKAVGDEDAAVSTDDGVSVHVGGGVAEVVGRGIGFGEGFGGAVEFALHGVEEDV